jgi:hypothetical protein
MNAGRTGSSATVYFELAALPDALFSWGLSLPTKTTGWLPTGFEVARTEQNNERSTSARFFERFGFGFFNDIGKQRALNCGLTQWHRALHSTTPLR